MGGWNVVKPPGDLPKDPEKNAKPLMRYALDIVANKTLEQVPVFACARANIKVFF